MKPKAPPPPDRSAPGSDSSTDSLDPELAAAPMHSSDAIVALRVVGTGHELPLPFGRSFRIGTGAQVEVRVPTAVAARKVSREHARLSREGDGDATWLRVVDLGSTNGTSFQGVRLPEFAVNAGQRFKLATTELMVMDKVLSGLRRALGGFFGFDDHARLDDDIGLIPHEPLVLIGDRGAERGHLAEALHVHSRRRHRPFLEISDAEQSRSVLATKVKAATGGTVFVSLDRLGRNAALAALIGVVFDRSVDVHPIFAARSWKEAGEVLSNAAQLFRPLTIPPVAKRAADVPALLDLMLEEQGNPHRVAELGSDRLVAMQAYVLAAGRRRVGIAPDGTPSDGKPIAASDLGAIDTGRIVAMSRRQLERLINSLCDQRGDSPLVTFDGLTDDELREMARRLRPQRHA